jgi:hypothetical protein
MAQFEDFDLLNDALNSVIFDGRFAMRPVYIDLDESIAKEVSDKVFLKEGELEEFLGKTVAGTLLKDGSDPYSQHTKRMNSWKRAGRSKPPPFTALLAALSLAAERMREDSQFSANNYYERLFEVLHVKQEGIQNSLKQKARSTRAFWRELNQWLTEHDFELGRPTARQVNSWKYVSYALSQSFIREADRQKLHDLFEEFELSPLDEIGESDMMLFLHDWMVGTGPSQWLRRLWNNVDLRERLAVAALSELESWDGGSSADGKQNRRLGWTAGFKTFPRRRLDLHLTTVGPEADDHIKLRLATQSSHVSKVAFAGCNGEPWLASAPNGEFSVLEPVGRIDIGALMLASLEMEAGTKATFRHVARPIIPLARSDTGIYYREVQRTSLLRRHVVLCHEQWVERVTGHLGLTARPGFRKSSIAELPGLPSGWFVFEDVEIVRVLEADNNNMASLVPLSEGISIRFDGGLRLSPQVWHCDVPPSVVAMGDQGAFKVEVRAYKADEDDDAILSGQSRNGGCEIGSSAIAMLEASELSVVAIVSGNESSEKNLALRDANLPRPSRGAELAYVIDRHSPSSILGARSMAGFVLGKGAVELRGMVIRGDIDQRETMEALPDGAFIEASGEDAQDDQPVETYLARRLEGLPESCVIRGYHYWMCEPARLDATRWEAKKMECKDCKMTAIQRNRRRGAGGRGRTYTVGNTQRASLPPVSNADAGVGLATILDGLSYLGVGSWHSFQSLASAHSSEPWFAHSFAQDLHDLGHLDFERTPDGRFASWSVAPPSLVVMPEGRAYLAGFRCSNLTDAVRIVLEEQGYEPAEEVADPHIVPRIAWDGLTLEEASRCLADLRDPLGRPIEVVECPGGGIASNVAPFSQLVESLAPVHLESTDGLECFDARRGRWLKAGNSNAEGAYRTNFAGRRYFVRDTSGTCRSASSPIARVFAARREGVRLHKYDPLKKQLMTSLGCDLPGLLSRAAVSCSGRLPSREQGKLVYSDVPAKLAQKILILMYGK